MIGIREKNFVATYIAMVNTLVQVYNHSCGKVMDIHKYLVY